MYPMVHMKEFIKALTQKIAFTITSTFQKLGKSVI